MAFRINLLFGFILLSVDCTNLAQESGEPVTREKVNFEYSQVTYLGQTVHVAKFPLKQIDLTITKSQGLEKPSVLCEREKGLACVNGGFFLGNGSAAGALKVAGKWLSYPPKKRGVVAWGLEGELVFDRLVYNSRTGKFDSSFHQNQPYWEQFTNVLGGAPLLLSNNVELDARDEKVLPTFITGRYARSALGTDAQQESLFLVVVDGGDRVTSAMGVESGLSIPELASFFKEQLDCAFALNLDGGRSSSLIIGGKRVNSTTFLQPVEREVGDVLVVKTK